MLAEGDCTDNTIKLLSIINGIQCFMILLIITILICKFLQNYKSPQNQGKLVFIAIIIFFLSIWGDIMTLFIGDILCFLDFEYIASSIRSNLLITLAYSQIYCLLYIFFIRFHSVMKTTKYRFSEFTLKIYYFSFIFIGICSIIVCILCIFISITANRLFFLFAALTMLSMLLLIISIIITFIHKLIKINQTECDQEVISVITKIIILTSISLFLTFIDFAVISCRILMESLLTVTLAWNISLWDIFSNFLCMILSYNTFNGYYKQFCGCLDQKCMHCLTAEEKEHADFMKDKPQKKESEQGTVDIKIRGVTDRDNGVNEVDLNDVNDVCPSMLQITTNSVLSTENEYELQSPSNEAKHGNNEFVLTDIYEQETSVRL